MELNELNRFMKYVNKTDSCWVWTGTKRKGYGRFYLGGLWYSSHRLSFEHFISQIPDSLLVLHSCDNPSCVNPNHLFLGDQSDNMVDMVNKKRHKTLKGSKNPIAKLTESKVNQIRNLYRLGGTSYAKLAKKYGVSAKLIEFVVRGRIWRHVN